MSMRYYISTEEASFFNNNSMGYGTGVPTSGTYKVGDFIISSKQENGIFGWVCVKAGTPGEWDVIGSGFAGGSGGGNVVVGYINSVSFNNTRNSIEIGIPEFNKGIDFLEVHYNGLLLAEGVHYNVSSDGLRIESIDGSWNESADDTQQMIFRVLKSEGVKVKEYKNTVDIDNACYEVEHGIPQYNSQFDIMEVHLNGVLLVEGLDYRVESDKLIKVDSNEAWNPYNVQGQKMFIKVMRNVIGMVEVTDNSVGVDKLTPELAENIEAIDDLLDIVGIQNTNISNMDNRITALEEKEVEIDLSGLQTQNKDLVGAINELFQNANNGKELIADAIGEPLDSSDTFQAMSNDIHGLLSTFKTNMIRNGVTVSGADKFKQLIDKIATLSDSEGKGLKFASGTVDDSDRYIYQDSTQTNLVIPFENELDFTPSIVFFCCNNLSTNVTEVGGVTVDAILSNDYHLKVVYPTGTNYHNLSIINITNSGFSIKINNVVTNSASTTVKKVKFKGGTYYAIGVGEEDTTLRDSLANILGDKGVDVSPEDDMATLIGKVDSISGASYNYNVKIFCQEEEPVATKFGDIWIPVESGSYDINLIEGSNTISNPMNDDITIKVIDKYVKVTMDESLNSFLSGNSTEFNINLNTNDFQTNTNACLIPLLANSVTQIFTKLGVVKKWDDTNNSWSVINAKYWNGTQWTTFSIDDPILYRGLDNGKLIAYNLETKTQLWSVNANMDLRSQIAIGNTNIATLTFGATTADAEITLSIRSKTDGSLIYKKVVGGTSYSSSDTIMYCKDGSFIRHQYDGSVSPGFRIYKYNETSGELMASNTLNSVYCDDGFMGMIDNKIYVCGTDIYDEPIVVVNPGDLSIIKSDQILPLTYSNYTHNVCVTKEGNLRVYVINSSKKTVYYDDFKLNVSTGSFTKVKNGTLTYTLADTTTGVSKVFNMIHPTTLEELHVIQTTVYDHDGFRLLIYNSNGTLLQTYNGNSYVYNFSMYYAGGNIVVTENASSYDYYPESIRIYNIESNTLSSELFKLTSNYSYSAAISHGTIGYYNENYGI